MKYQETQINGSIKQSFNEYLNKYTETLRSVFGSNQNLLDTSVTRGVPGIVMRDILDCDPLKVFIPKEYNGRGTHTHECLKILETSSYYSLPLSLMVGINGALFLQPLSLYGSETKKKEVYRDFIEKKNMGGLMITEPKYGSDALHMQTHYSQNEDGSYHIKGMKHWAGLTGWADYWVLTARRKDSKGNLSRDIDFFIHSKANGGIVVEEVFNNLGLYMLPYGRNQINTTLQEDSKLIPKTTGVKMMLDILHRSRLQFPGMAMGFIKRNLDEALIHCKDRFVGGKQLFDYDQVQHRISKIQAAFTTCSAMCAFVSKNVTMSDDCSRMDLSANTIKTLVTDYMQETAQSLLQLVGAKGYTQEHVAGKGTIDSRPFQIFEGSNDILYQQITESVIKSMRRAKLTNLYEFLKDNELSTYSSDRLKDVLDFNIDYNLTQRKLVELGKVLSRVISMNFVIDLGEKGFRSDLISNAMEHLKHEINMLVSSYNSLPSVVSVADYKDESSWENFFNK
ncbi:MAG: acyl-CoA/acyl-ACP dehydrogenase [Balneolales bacterium]|nr:acyl-CoA/acyl-ACP dehydrogenase [Balneolales bacterium]